MTRLRDDIAVIAASDLFDAGWYLRQYPDVALLGMGAAEHYLRIGAALGRDPSPAFSTTGYFDLHPAVERAGLNPLVHYLRYGQAEERAVTLTVAREHESRWSPASLSAADLGAVRAQLDEDFYRRQSPDLGAQDPLEHYLTLGWRLGRDPSATFSTAAYLKEVPGVVQSGVNPLVHHVLHGGAPETVSPYKRWHRESDLPTVTAIVPNYNHARFLRQRIDSILEQTYPHVEVLLLDDCSTDDSREVIAEYVERHPGRVRAILNEQNAGNLFRQWRRGLEAATGDLVWICESDDFCEPDFLDWLVPHFRDRSVQVAFGRIQFSDRDGELQPGLDAYRTGAEPGIWQDVTTRPAARWFAGGFGVNNVIANVGGCVWRRQDLSDEVWAEAETYTILGDWFLYSHVSGGGQIAFDPSAVAYFRQHGLNTSVNAFKGTAFYDEHRRFMTHLRQRWDVPDETVDRFVEKVAFQWQHFAADQGHGTLEQHVDAAALKRVGRNTPHVLMAFLGFHPGGGEAFPIALANALHRQGWLVSMVAHDLQRVNDDMAAALDPGIAVYSTDQVRQVGLDRFVQEVGVSVIHSHMVSLDDFFLLRHRLDPTVRYLVSMHGSHEAVDLPREKVERLAQRVDHWAYTAERNLELFDGLLRPGSTTRMANGMPPDPLPFPQTRAELGIAEDAVVFAFVARGIEGKGWDAAPAALARLRDQRPGVPLHLLLVGTGSEADLAEKEWGEDPDISFLGFQARVNGLYRLSDVALVPTRFPGESYPLCVIQALQESLPIVATDNGQIREMVTTAGGEVAGRLVPFLTDDEAFVETLTEAMAAMLDPAARAAAGRLAGELGTQFDIARVAGQYGDLYRALLDDKGLGR